MSSRRQGEGSRCAASGRSSPRRGQASGARGQVAVEAAISMSLTTFLILGIIQLGMMHQAQLMTQLAAYRAARAGIVNSGDCNVMLDSAMTALIPTFGPTPPVLGFSIPGRADSPARAFLLWQTYMQLNDNVAARLGFPLVAVQTVNPRRADLNNLFNNYGRHLSNREIDFDDMRNAQVIDANLLSIRVKYWYRLRIPFANWNIHTMWVGQNILRQFKGIQFEVQQVAGVADRPAAQAYAQGQGGDLALSARVAALTNLYYIPIRGSYTMRMQSNLMRNRVLPCAVDN